LTSLPKVIDVTLDPAIALLIVLCTALLFASAALHKFRDLRRFEEIFAAYGLMPAATRLPVARAVPSLEVLVAAGLLLEVSRTAATCVGIALLSAYAVAIAINLSRGRRDLACGCGGPDDRRPIAAWMIWRNILIASVSALVMLPWSSRPLALTDMITIGCGAAAAVLVYLCLDSLLGRASRWSAQTRVS
jgi:hypothetical protein